MADILNQVAPDASQQAVLTMAVEGWRFARISTRVLQKLDASDQARYAGQLRYFVRHIEETLAGAGLRLVDLQGQSYDAGLPVVALNLDEFGPSERLEVDQMLEPILMGPEGVLRTGTVMLRKAD